MRSMYPFIILGGVKMKEPIRIAHIVGKWVGGGVEAVIMNYYRNIDSTI